MWAKILILGVLSAAAAGCITDPPPPVEEIGRDAGPRLDARTTDSSDCRREDQTAWFRDADGDGFGDSGDRVGDCAAPDGYVDNGDDCDDSTANRRPGVVDRCDGIDNDCDDATPDVCPAACVPVDNAGRHYMFCGDSRAFADAESVCRNEGLDLVQLDSPEEDLWVFTTVNDLLGAPPYWIGGSDRTTEGTWQWPDGSTFWQGGSDGTAPAGTYTNWDSDEPNNAAGEDCIEIRDDQRWNDENCGETQLYVCEQRTP